MAAAVGAAPNTGSLAWVVPRCVAAGVYYFAVRPLTGQRRLEVRAVNLARDVVKPLVCVWLLILTILK